LQSVWGKTRNYFEHQKYHNSLSSSTPCVEKFFTFKLTVTQSNHNPFSNFQKFCSAGMRMNCYKTHTIQHYLPHLKHVATLPCKITNSDFLQIFSGNGRKCKQILIFSVFKRASLFPHCLQIKFSMSLFFTSLIVLIYD